jgi:putative ABC transport system permease protein
MNFSALRSAPGAFVRSLVRLRRFPPVLVAVLGAGAVVGIASATGPMVVSSAGNAAIAGRVSGPTGAPAGVRAEADIPLSWDRAAFRLPLIEDRLRGLPLPPPVVTVLGAEEATVSAGGKHASVQMLTRTGFLAGVERVAGSGSDGLWVPASAATALGLRPGSTATVAVSGIRTEFRVAGIYRDLDPRHIPAFWTPLSSRLLRPPQFPPPPPPLLGDLRPFLETEGRLFDKGTLALDVAVPVDLRLRDARHVASVISTLKDAVGTPESPLFGSFDVVESLLPTLVEQADETVATTTQPVQAISLAGELAALILAGAAGMFLARRRTVEFGLLSARGTSPRAMGFRTAIEALLPAAVGGAVGLFAARALTTVTGPGGPVDPQAIGTSAVRVAIGAVIAALVVGGFTAVAVRMDSPDRRARAPKAARPVWEVALLALAGASAYEILTRGTGTVGPSGLAAPPKLDLLVLAFPFVFVAATAGLAVRVLRALLPKLRKATTGRRPWVFLTAARVAGSPRLASVLVLVAGISVGVLTYANVLSASVERTADAKAVLTVGSDALATTGSLPSIGGHPPFEWTPVEVVPAVQVDPAGPQVDVLAIDPDSFAKAAAWIGAFSGPPKALASLAGDQGGSVPAILVGTSLPPKPTLAMSGTEVPLRPVASMDVFPGVPRNRPTLVVARTRLEAEGPDLAGFDRSFQLWARGDPTVILRAFKREGFDPTFFVTAAAQRDSPGFLALSWTFGLLQTFGALAGILSVLGAVLYLQARQQQRDVMYALARRMGLGRREHRRSIALELGGMLLAAYVIGAGFATAAAFIVHGKVDPLPNLPPGPLFRFPITVLAVVAASIVVLAWAGAMRVQRRADHANVGELLRRAG